ncbi:hypothetical protein CPB83DRAFT_861384 [Crepidotus variabilis]|uniref:FHA domain-containing protein n=1 Tax=Crepidotus variabilis TaxID=179855 RepID=A0A9P6E7Y3_9AGAR|nr:hypothetical protein CPB83DRAFT_861384 [Crepidotus variabilis]
MPAPAPFPPAQINGVGHQQPPAGPPTMNGGSSSQSNIQYPALYLYPLNDTWAPKHITLTSQHTKIGRQTSSKTAPGERNGFFDSKVLSRQHAEVWEEGSKIYIKDVRSSNGTFINGERLSTEGQESEPFELKSDDIVEFGIDIVGEDNKTIIHHKVAARVVCVFNEQDAQVAARAEQHQQQQQIQQQQYLQQQAGGNSGGAASSSMGPSPTGSGGPMGSLAGGPGSAGPQSFPFAAQRRAQLAQQGLGGMGGIRTPGKTGLSFDVILSRLQGELQKSRETTAELTTLTGTMGDIHETLGGNLPSNLPPFPSNLPPVRPPQEAGAPPAGSQPSGSSSPEQPVPQAASNISASAVEELQSQLRDTQSSLASHLDKVRALEGWIAEQETMKREVNALKEMIEERRKEMEEDRVHVEERIRREVDEVKRGRSLDRDEDGHSRREEGVETREIFGMVDEDDLHDVMDDDDDARSISTVMAHELERVDEEDEEQLAREEEQDHEQVDEVESVRPLEDVTAETRAADEAEERRQEDLNVGRPRTPEPSRLGLLHSSRRSITSPLSHSSTTELRTNSSNTTSDEIHEQVAKLSKQLNSVIQLTSTLEAQHSAAQNTIKGLEGKVDALEDMLRGAQEALAAKDTVKPTHADAVASTGDHTKPEIEEKQYTSLVSMMSEWKKSVEGKWSSVHEEWSQERERLAKAREDFETKLKAVDNGLEKVASLQSSLVREHQRIEERMGRHEQLVNGVITHSGQSIISSGIGSFHHHLNGEAIKHTGGLVTPPSPRSQSSDSGRYRRRRKRSPGMKSRGRSGSGERAGSESGDPEDVHDDDADTDATLASSTEDDIDAKARALAIATASAAVGSDASSTGIVIPIGTHLATPASSVGSLEPESRIKGSSIPSKRGSMSTSASEEDEHTEDLTHPDVPKSSGSIAAPMINTHAAVGVVLLSVAAAAVFWKVKE